MNSGGTQTSRSLTTARLVTKTMDGQNPSMSIKLILISLLPGSRQYYPSGAEGAETFQNMRILENGFAETVENVCICEAEGAKTLELY